MAFFGAKQKELCVCFKFLSSSHTLLYYHVIHFHRCSFYLYSLLLYEIPSPLVFNFSPSRLLFPVSFHPSTRLIYFISICFFEFINEGKDRYRTHPQHVTRKQQHSIIYLLIIIITNSNIHTYSKTGEGKKKTQRIHSNRQGTRRSAI